MAVRPERPPSQLLLAFEVAGEAAYGTYWTLLIRPLREELGRAGLLTQPAFPGDLEHSVENDGPQSTRERRMFYMVLAKQSRQPLGTLVISSFHDHIRFRIPRAPR